MKKNILSLIAIFTLVVSSYATLAFANINLGGENGTTGANSENENEWNITGNMDLEIENEANIDNIQGFDLESGRNDIENNTVVDDVLGGDISGDISIVNNLNDSDIDLPVSETGDMNFDFSNGTTGSNSVNHNEVMVALLGNVEIENEVVVLNDLALDANTGRNDIENNTEVGNVASGDIDFNIEIENRANTGMSDIEMGHLDAMDISGDFSNDTTGSSSENENEITINGDMNLEIENEVDINNATAINANTGRNDIENNTVVGDVSSGNIRIDFSELNIAN